MATDEGTGKVVVRLEFDREWLENEARSYAMFQQEPSLPISTVDLRAALDTPPEEGERVTAHRALSKLEPPEYAEKDFGAGTSLLAAYRAGYFDAKRDALLELNSTTKDPEEGR